MARRKNQPALRMKMTIEQHYMLLIDELEFMASAKIAILPVQQMIADTFNMSSSYKQRITGREWVKSYLDDNISPRVKMEKQ